MTGIRKARTSGCGHYLTGGLEILGADGIWRCTECANLARLMAEPPRPGRGGQDDTTEKETSP